MPKGVIFSQEVMMKLHREAELYQKMLLDQTVEIVYNNRPANETTSIAIQFKAENFAHLAGIKAFSRINSAKDLFDKCLNNSLQHGDARFTHSETFFEMKADVFSRIAKLDLTAKELGDYDNGSAIALNADKIVGETPACLAIIEYGETYIPTSLLNYDIRSIVQEDTYTKVLATLKYPIGQRDFAHIELPNQDLTPKEIEELSSYLTATNLGQKLGHPSERLLPDVNSPLITNEPSPSDRLKALEEENAALRLFIEEQQMLKPDGVTDIHEMIDNSIKRAVEEGRTTTKNRSIGKRKQKTL